MLSRGRLLGLYGLVLFMVAVPLGAAPGSAAFPKTKRRLEERVDAFWKAWQARNQHRIFLLYAPSYRKETSELAFLQLTQGMLGITPVEYKLGAIEIQGPKATVTLDAQTMIAPFGVIPNKLVQHWTYESGDWYRVMDPPSFPSPPPASVVTAPMTDHAAPGISVDQPMSMPVAGASPPTASPSPSPSPTPRP